VTLASSKGKSCASLDQTRRHKSSRLRGLAPGDLRNFAGRCRKFRTAIVAFRSRSRSGSCLGSVVASQLHTQRFRALQRGHLGDSPSGGFCADSAPPDDVFAFVDDHARFSSHMSQSLWMMGGGRWLIVVTLALVQGVADRRSPPTDKVWETVGTPTLLVIGVGSPTGFEPVLKREYSIDIAAA
jgi:hypothetical protein